jgi:hypothetical protein
MCINRVASRVENGGHHIPEAVIRRRYTSGISNLFHVYRSILDGWVLFDNSLGSPYLIAQETIGSLVVVDAVRFAKCFNMSFESKDDTLRESPTEPYWLRPLIALRLAKLDVIEDHCRTGQPIIIWRDGKVYHQPPQEAKREMEELMRKNPNWLTMP